MSNYTYQHDPRISGADFEANEKPDMCPKCQSDNTDFTPCSRCVGTGGFESGNGWDEPRSWDACDDCGGMGGQYVC